MDNVTISEFANLPPAQYDKAVSLLSAHTAAELTVKILRAQHVLHMTNELLAELEKDRNVMQAKIEQLEAALTSAP